MSLNLQTVFKFNTFLDLILGLTKFGVIIVNKQNQSTELSVHACMYLIMNKIFLNQTKSRKCFGNAKLNVSLHRKK